jgi:hypothetical protein
METVKLGMSYLFWGHCCESFMVLAKNIGQGFLALPYDQVADFFILFPSLAPPLPPRFRVVPSFLKEGLKKKMD